MSFSSGTFTLVAGNPVVTGTTISSTVQNNTMNDVATGLSTCILKDGTQTATASVPFAQGLSSSALADISAAGAGQIKFPATQNSSSNGNTLDDYVEYTAASSACTGALTVSVVWKLTKIGNKVTLTLPITAGAGVAAATFVYGVVIPAAYRPSGEDVKCLVPIVDNAAILAAPGVVIISNSTGSITVAKTTNSGSNFTVTATCGLDSATGICWTI